MAKLFFLFMYRWIELRNIQEPFIRMVVSGNIYSTTSSRKRTKVTGMTSVKKLVNLSVHFTDAAKLNWEPMELFENRRYLTVFVTVCDNLSKCVLNTLQLVNVEIGQTPEERVAVIKATTHQGIKCQHSSLICQILSNPP